MTGNGMPNTIKIIVSVLTLLLGSSIVIQVNVDFVPVPISETQKDTMTQIIIPILTLLWGAGLSIFGVTQGNTLGEAIRNKLIGADYVLGRYNNLVSFHAITAVITVNVKGVLTEATLNGVSSRAAHFYGIEPENVPKQLLGKSGRELAEELEEYVEPEHYKKFLEDQNRVFNNYIDGKPAIARMPVIFNDRHPYYNNCAFLPVIVSLGEERQKRDGSSQRLIQIAYLMVSDFMPAVDMYREANENRNTAD